MPLNMRLLWIQPGAIGDFVVSMPGMVWVRETLKPTWFEVWAERANLPLVQAPGQADRAVALADTGIDRYALPEGLLDRLREFDLVLSWWGTGVATVTRMHPNSYFLKALPQGTSHHILDFKRSQLEALFSPASADFPPHPTIYWTPEDIQFAKRCLEDCQDQAVAVVHPGASGEGKRWPAIGFASVADWLVARGMRVLLAEGPLDRSATDEIARLAAASAHPFEIQRLRIGNLRQLSAVLGLCALYVGNDSGISHLAAASGTPTLAIFTVTAPQVWAPRGPNVWICVNPTVDEVWAKLNDEVLRRERLPSV